MSTFFFPPSPTKDVKIECGPRTQKFALPPAQYGRGAHCAGQQNPISFFFL